MNADNNVDNEMIEFGPFTNIQLDEFERFFAKHQISYEVIARDEELQQLIDKHNEANKHQRYAQPFSGAFIYFKIARNDMERITPELEKMGLISSSTGEAELAAEDYMCTTCDYHSQSPGRCPTCHTALVDFSTYINHSRDHKMTADKKGLFIALILGLAAAAFMYLK